MSGILRTIEKPAVILAGKGNADLFFERIENKSHHCVVLRWDEYRSRYQFKSSHVWSSAEVAAARRPGGLRAAPVRGKKKAPMNKSLGACSAITVFDLSGSGAYGGDPSDTHAGGRSRQIERIRFVADLIKAIPAGARWITVRPNGPGTEGQPVLIQDNPDGSAHVIGGAGGKLNYLKLRSVRKESEYQAEAAKRRAAKTEAKKEQRKADKEAGLAEAKKEARDNLRVQRMKHESEFVRKVAETMGWEMSQLEFPEHDYEHLSEAAAKKVRGKFHRDLMKRALDAVDVQRQRLVTDADSRMQADIGEIPLDTDDVNTLSVQDLAPVQVNPAGLGFSSDYKARAEEAGLTDEELAAETKEIRTEKQSVMTDGQRKAAIARGETAKMVREELKDIREPVIEASISLADAKQAVELLKAQKQLRQIQKKARAAAGEIDRSATEPKAYVLEYTADPDLDSKVMDDLANDLRTIQTQAFLSEFRRIGGPDAEAGLGAHIATGAYNSVNALALAAGGEALVDRSVVDVLGVAGAAQVLARRLHTDLSTEEIDQVTDGVQDFHVHHYMEMSEEAMNQARDLMDAAKEVEIGEASSAADLQVAQELNARRKGAIADAQKILGRALGEMEANAALAVALKRGKTDEFQVSLGQIGIEDAVRQVRAIGLQRGDYTISHVGPNAFLTVTGDGMDRLSKPVNREDLAQVRRNLDIIGGAHDEDGWLPLGVANRPDLALDVKPGVAPRMAEAFSPGEDLQQSLRDYIGGRAADGDSPADIVADIQSADFLRQVGDRVDDYRAALDAVAPLKGEDGKLRRAEELSGQFEKFADEFVAARGSDRAPIHRQKFAVDKVAVDALHRALSDTPEGAAAYKQVGELDRNDQKAIREFFHQHIAKESPEAGDLRRELERHGDNEPERETTDMFGEATENPAWSEWRSKRDELQEKVSESSLTWPKYVESMRGNERAYEAVQDLIRSRVGKAFADNYNKLNPSSPLKVGKTTIRNNLNHLDATDPKAREVRLQRERALIDGLRERSQGRYASGSVTEKMDAARERQAAFEQSQMGFFASEEAPADAPIELGGDERHTIGHQAEMTIAGMMGQVGRNFKPGQPLRLWAPTMSGGKNAPRQRLIKMLEANKRVVAAFGTGSGKSLLQLAGFSHLHAKGKVNRGLFLVPSIVQGQFSGEALRYLEPGKYKWHIEPGAGRQDRIAAYKDPENHFAVMTHASFRDDMLHLGAKHEGIPESEMSDRLNAMPAEDRKAWMRGIMDREGINFDYLTVDEGQTTLNRKGKENSALANVVDSLSAHTPYYMTASADPVKNDASEIHDLMSKMDPERYKDRSAFMRRYGADTTASKDALRREMARYVYPSKIDPDVKDHRIKETIPLSDGQRAAIADLDKHFSNARIARMQGKVDVDAVRAIWPAALDGVPEDKVESVAKEVQQHLGLVKNSAVMRILQSHPDNPTVDDIVKKAAERKGKPGVVFARSLDAVKVISDRLAREGHRVVTITGADSAAEKERKRLMFRPESGEAQADILIASDAGATGMNVQRGQWLYQADTPQTAMVHAQRQGRIFRTGQTNDVELIDAVQDHPEIHRARDRLAKKYGLRELMNTPFEGLDDTGIAYFLKQRQVDQEQRGLF